MKNFEKEIGRKTFLECVWLGGEKENKQWSPSVFFPNPPQSFLFKMKRKLKIKIGYNFWTKIPTYNYTFTQLFFTLFSLLFFLRCPSFFYFIYFILFLLGRRCLPPVSFLFFFFFLLIYWVGFSFSFFLFLFRCDFSYGHDFQFLINLGD